MYTDICVHYMHLCALKYVYTFICTYMDSVRSVVSINMRLHMWDHIQRYEYAFLGCVCKCDSCVHIITFKYGSAYAIRLLSM